MPSTIFAFYRKCLGLLPPRKLPLSSPLPDLLRTPNGLAPVDTVERKQPAAARATPNRAPRSYSQQLSNATPTSADERRLPIVRRAFQILTPLRFIVGVFDSPRQTCFCSTPASIEVSKGEGMAGCRNCRQIAKWSNGIIETAEGDKEVPELLPGPPDPLPSPLSDC
jgi:hypothetical protein